MEEGCQRAHGEMEEGCQRAHGEMEEGCQRAHSDVEIEGRVPVIFNNCYGGRGWSDEAGEFMAKNGTLTDAEVLYELGSKRASGQYAQLAVRWMDRRFVDADAINDNEYDGRERPTYNRHRYRSYHLDKLVRDVDPMTPEEAKAVLLQVAEVLKVKPLKGIWDTDIRGGTKPAVPVKGDGPEPDMALYSSNSDDDSSASENDADESS